MLSVILSATLGSAVATLVYFVWQGAVTTSDEWQMLFIVSLIATCFTIPGSILLAVSEFALSARVDSEQALDGAVLAIGALAGAGILGSLAFDVELALLGAFYGFTTAVLFVAFQRTLGSRLERLV